MYPLSSMPEGGFLCRLFETGRGKEKTMRMIASQKTARVFARTLLCILLLCQLGFIAASLYLHPERYLNADDASEMVLAEQIAREGRFVFSHNWYYSTEIRVLSPHLFWTALFRLTNDWPLVRAAGTVLTLVCLLAAYFYFVRSAGLGLVGECMAPLLLSPFCLTYFFFVDLIPYYAAPVSAPFVVLGCYFSVARDGQARRRGRLAWVAAAAFGFLFGMGGIRGVMTLLIPLLLTAAVLFFRTGKGFAALRERKFLFPLTIAAAGAGGFAVNQFLLRLWFPAADLGATLLRRATGQDINSILWDIFSFFGYEMGVPVFSLEGVSGFCAVGLGALYFYCLFRVARRLDRYGFVEQTICLFSLLALAANLAIVFCVDMYAPRYMAPVLIMYLPVYAVFFLHREPRAEKASAFQKTLALAAAGCLLVTVLTGYRGFLHYSNGSLAYETAEYLNQNGYWFGYGSHWNANILTEFSNGKIRCATIEDFDGLRIRPWLTCRENGAEAYEGKAFVILSNEEYGREKEFLAYAAKHGGGVTYQNAQYKVFGFDSIQPLLAYQRESETPG